MTVIIAYSTPEIAFLAADSFRWDFVQRRNVGPVCKLHQARSGDAFAVGGAFIDRTQLAASIKEARLGGEPFIDSARRLSHPLFNETRVKMRVQGVEGEQFCICWYAETNVDGCSVTRHRLPEDRIETVQGFDFSGPDTPWLTGEATKLLGQSCKGGRLALDTFAFRLIEIAAYRHPRSVGFPAMAIILHRDGNSAAQHVLHPSLGFTPHSDFEIAYTHR